MLALQPQTVSVPRFPNRGKEAFRVLRYGKAVTLQGYEMTRGMPLYLQASREISRKIIENRERDLIIFSFWVIVVVAEEIVWVEIHEEDGEIVKAKQKRKY